MAKPFSVLRDKMSPERRKESEEKVKQIIPEMPDCGSNSCKYALKRGGMRVNGPCRCDECPTCGAHLNPLSCLKPPFIHRDWCGIKEWVPSHWGDKK